MGHAVHFLSRLQRMSPYHMELAKQLYYNPPLVRAILTSFGGTEERVAIALDTDANPPHVIVSRDGDFVTCLGRGMGIGGRPVMSRQLVDSFIEYHARLKKSLQSIDLLSQERWGKDGIVGAIRRKADALSVEDFADIMAVQSLLLPAFYEGVTTADEAVLNRRDYLISLLRKNAKAANNKRHRHLFEAFWRDIWEVANYCVLINAEGYDEQLVSDRGDLLGNLHMTAASTGHIAIALRALWSASMRGPDVIAWCERTLHISELPLVIEAVAVLVVSALRHPGLRDEVERILERYLATAANVAQVPFKNRLCQIGKSLLAAPEPYSKRQRRVGWGQYQLLKPDLSPGHPYDFESIDEVPDNLLMTLAISVDQDFRYKEIYLAHFLGCLPWLAQAEARDLFLPRALTTSRDHVAACVTRLTDHQKMYSPPKPERAAATPGRNDPCSCGSGKKFKRCCMRGRED